MGAAHKHWRRCRTWDLERCHLRESILVYCNCIRFWLTRMKDTRNIRNGLAAHEQMVPVTIMPLAGAGAVAPKGDSNSGGRPRPWPVPHTFSLRWAICALSYVAMGLSGKMVG